MMKRKVKRFDEGGEAELKKRGLEESKNERVGFFERLRMGNIDKPGSEAYEKFGAGRGRAAEAKQREAQLPKDTTAMKARSEYTGTRFGQPDVETDKKQAKDEESKGPFSNVEAAVKSATSRDTESSAPAPVKKAMKVAEKAEPKKAAPKKEAESKYEDTGAKVGSQGSFKFDSKPMSVEEARKKAKEMTSGKGLLSKITESPMETAERKAKEIRESKQAKSGDSFFKRFTESPMEKAERKAKEIRGYKSGGSVSSASKRADGIAQRGKTRGRIC